MNKAYDIATRPSKAQEMYNMMQRASTLLQSMTSERSLYPALCDASFNQDALNFLFDRIGTCSTLV